MLLLALCLSACGCTVGPDYHGPTDQPPKQWSQTRGGIEPVEATTPWWRAFHDKGLDQLVETAVAANADLQRARAAVVEARAAIRQAAGGGAPQLNASTGLLSTRSYSPPTYSPVETYGTAGFDASWEVDLWGKTARAVEAAAANEEGAQATADDAMVTLLGDVARNYAELRGFQAQLAVARDSVENQRRDTTLAQTRLHWGAGTRFEVLQGQASLATAQSAIPPLEAQIQVRIDALSVLCGKAPNVLAPLLLRAGAIPAAALPRLGVPADLIRRRPDVRAAERAVATAVAQVGVAIANEYPTLSITGTLAFNATSLASLLTQPAFAIGPTLSLPLLDGGVRQAQVDIQRSRVDQARWVYRGFVLKALQEVEDAMAIYEAEQGHHAKLAETVTIAEKQVDAAKALYLAGEDGFFQVLNAQHVLDDARLQLAQSETALATSAVAFYKALGGGWQVAHATPPIAPDAGYGEVSPRAPIGVAPPIPDIGRRPHAGARPDNGSRPPGTSDPR